MFTYTYFYSKQDRLTKLQQAPKCSAWRAMTLYDVTETYTKPLQGYTISDRGIHPANQEKFSETSYHDKIIFQDRWKLTFLKLHIMIKW